MHAPLVVKRKYKNENFKFYKIFFIFYKILFHQWGINFNFCKNAKTKNVISENHEDL